MSSEVPGSGLKPEENVFSLEDLDKIIEAEDPGFKDEMDNIRSTGQNIQADIESIDVDAEEDVATQNEEEEKTLKKRILKKILSPFVKLKDKIKLKWLAYKNSFQLLSQNFLHFLRHELPDRLRYYKSLAIKALNSLNATLKNWLLWFKQLSRLEKLSAVAVIAGIATAFLLMSKIMTGAWLPRFVNPLVLNLENEASFVGTIKDKSDMQNLFQAFPEAEHYVLLNKIIVNFRKDRAGEVSPKGIFEFYLGLDSQDTAIEVKDREREILDIAQRALEPFTYSEVNSITGRSRMKSVIKEQINLALNQGQVFQVYFNTFITHQ